MEHPSRTSAADMLAVDVQYLSRRDLVAAFGAGRRQLEGFGVEDENLRPGSGRGRPRGWVHCSAASTSTLTVRRRETACLTVASLLKAACPRTKRFPDTVSVPSYTL